VFAAQVEVALLWQLLVLHLVVLEAVADPSAALTRQAVLAAPPGDPAPRAAGACWQQRSSPEVQPVARQATHRAAASAVIPAWTPTDTSLPLPPPPGH